MLTLLILVVVFALVFDFINGFHDAANAIATTVGTGALSIRAAVVMSGLFNFFGALMGTAVAGFIASQLASEADVSLGVVLATLVAASAWNLITWWYGIPSSSSHALIGGLAGAVVAHAGWGAFHWANLVKKVALPIVISPLLGFLAAFVLMTALIWLVRRRRPSQVNRSAKYLQLISACTFSFAHGSNDAQKVMGIITLALVAYMQSGPVMPDWLAANGWLLPSGKNARNDWIVPVWVIFACALAMCFGTMAGGKRIIKTMGAKIVRLTPPQGFCAETAGTGTILLASHLGIPVSTTHCISAAILGVGTTRGIGHVRWGVAVNIVFAWILTIPISAGIAWLVMEIFELLGVRG